MSWAFTEEAGFVMVAACEDLEPSYTQAAADPNENTGIGGLPEASSRAFRRTRR
jgi:hypothetical protein